MLANSIIEKIEIIRNVNVNNFNILDYNIFNGYVLMVTQGKTN